MSHRRLKELLMVIRMSFRFGLRRMILLATVYIEPTRMPILVPLLKGIMVAKQTT